MNLPDDEVRAVRALIDFLYRGSIPRSSDTTMASVSKAANELLSLYILAEKICMPELMDRTIDELAANCSKGNIQLGDSAIKKVYKNTQESSKLRAYCVAASTCCMAFVDNVDDAWCDKRTQISETCPEFFVDTFRFLAKNLKNLSAYGHRRAFDLLHSIAGSCSFHTHRKNEDCYLKIASREFEDSKDSTFA